MIKDTRRGIIPVSMMSKESFDDFYRRKLDMLNIKLKNVIKGSIPFVVGPEYACGMCHRRIKLHIDGRIYCLSCQRPWGLSKAQNDVVVEIMRGYPKLEECADEWQEIHGKELPREPRLPRAKYGDAELGRQIKAAREKMGMSTHDLAARVTKVRGGRLTERSIRAYEGGSAQPSKNVMGQLKEILGLDDDNG